MTEDRRTKPAPTPGEDPREIDEERRKAAALDHQAGQDGIVHPQEAESGLGTSADAPGRDLDDLDDAYEPRRLRNES
ncbi:MAG TPA: hypothetical protein VFZ63_12975 [Jiangellaceae bacterium]